LYVITYRSKTIHN